MARRIATVLGLHSVMWSSGEELMVARDEMVARHPGSILVQASDPAATRTVVARLSELLRRTLDVAQSLYESHKLIS